MATKTAQRRSTGPALLWSDAMGLDVHEAMSLSNSWSWGFRITQNGRLPSIVRSMRLRRLCVAVTVLVCVVGTVGSADAHPGDTWYWGSGLAELKILSTVQARNALRADSVTDAQCDGVGVSILKQGTRKKLYKHFRCFIQWQAVTYDSDGFPNYRDQEGERVLHVLGRFSFTLSTV